VADEAITLLKQQLADAQKAMKAMEKDLAAATTKAALADTLTTQVTDLKAEMKLAGETHTAAIDGVKAEHAADLTFSARGVTDPTWRNYFAAQHKEQAALEGGVKDLSAWIDGMVAAPDKVADPILKNGLSSLKIRPVDTPAGGAPAGGAGLPKLPAGGPSGRGPAAGAGQYGSEQAMKQAFSDPATIQANWAALQQQHPEFAGLPSPVAVPQGPGAAGGSPT